MNVALLLGCSAILLLLSNTSAKNSAAFDLEKERELDEAFNQILKRALDENAAVSFVYNYIVFRI